MGKALIIVESPAKIKTLKKFLGPNYIFESSIGHIRDLPEKEFGIDIEHGFEPKYTVLPNKEEIISRLRKAAKQCDVVYLSPDPDREGEAIAWHIMQILPPQTNIKRVAFNSITKEAVLKALENPRSIDIALVNAQQARRLLDRIVGYKISPLLNRRIQRGRENFLSAGRVQSVALKLVVDREKEIEAFKPVEYWNIGAILKTGPQERLFRAYLYSVDGKRFEKEPVEGREVTLIGNKEAADAILARMRPGPFEVVKVERKEKRRNPVPPFITSTLQQEASRHYGFSSSRTMGIAQGLYEGVDLGAEGPEGLITYMRTDSVRVAPEAITEVRRYIQNIYGPEYIPLDIKQYSTQKTAQDAHEAIRPTNLNNPPEKIKAYLTREQFLLYQLVWRRFLASQMVAAIYDTVTADLVGGEGVALRATGSIMKFPGFLAVYEEKSDDEEKEDENRLLPDLYEGQSLLLEELTAEQAFTRPPPRYTEASLVKELEKSGIGRPSTYATIMNKIQSREYTVKENGRLKPTELGKVIAQMLESNFQQIMNIDFTAKMEDNLELVAENNKDWKSLIQEFWDQFNPTLETAFKEAFVPKIMTDIDCPKCGEGKLQKIWAKSKYFYGCSRYPECNYSAPIEEVTFNKEDYAADFNWEQPCPICGSEMKVRHGRYGAFLGCTRYPECKGIINIPKKGEAAVPQEDLPPCPAIGCPGHMVVRKSRFGKIFYSCSTFPDCDVIVNQLDQLATKYPDHPRTPFQKKERKGKAKAAEKPLKGISKTKVAKNKAAKSKSAKPAQAAKTKSERKLPTYHLSPDLAAVVGASELTRGEVTKKVWDYIKAHHLQDEINKRLICPDALLSKVFGSSKPIDMFKMAGLLNAHMQTKP
jgi:DNA topoisomerase-1